MAAAILSSCSTRQAFSVVTKARQSEVESQKNMAVIEKNGSDVKPARPDLLEDVDPDEPWFEDEFSATIDQNRDMIMKEFQNWEGTPHRMGGNTKRGIDCSGFAHYIYKNLFNLDVPRSSKEFMSTGQKISKDELRPGDLVVFAPRSYPRHVGIYVGGNKFIHASYRWGIKMSDMDESYWKRSYRMSRRIIRE